MERRTVRAVVVGALDCLPRAYLLAQAENGALCVATLARTPPVTVGYAGQSDTVNMEPCTEAFNLVDTKSRKFFGVICGDAITRGPAYRLYVSYSRVDRKKTFFCISYRGLLDVM